MAKCLGPDSPYGCGHHLQHMDAARKGWITRRHGTQFAGTRQHKALSALFGEEISHAHTAKEHRGMVRFKNAGKWYELPRQEFNRLAREGEAHIREQERAQRQHEQATAKAQKDEERQKLQEEQYKRAQERQLAAARKAEYQSVTKRIKQLGGIRPYRKSATTGKTPELEEWKDLPQNVKTRDEKKGVALDDAAATISEEFPWLRIQNDSELRRYLTDKKHTGPMPRQAAPEPKPAAPKVVISQKSNGQWIVNRLYPSGEVRGDPTTYPSKAAAEKAASSQRAAGAGVVKPAMFGEEQEKRETYGAGLFHE